MTNTTNQTDSSATSGDIGAAQDRRALELALGALIAAQPRDISPKGWERHEQAINAAGCALNKPARTTLAPQAATPLPEQDEQALEDLMHKHGLIGVAGDNPNLEARLIAFAADALAQQAAPVAPPPGDSSNPVYWYAVLVKCARLLDLPADEPIPSGVLRAIEKLTDTPSTEATRQCLDNAKRGQK